MFAAVAFALVALPAAAMEDGAAPAPQGVHAFVAAYPEHLVGVADGALVWRDGARTPLAELGAGATATPDAALDEPRHAATESVSSVDYEPIFFRMYGDCRAGETAARLAPLRWNRGGADGGRVVLATAVNGVAARLQLISDELDRLGPDFATYLRPLGGTAICRPIALSRRLSLHGFGIAIDINPTHGDYWITAPRDGSGQPLRRNRIPQEIVAVFERHGFVWGGRWHRFDTFHFEYRPEYRAALGGQPFPERLTSAGFSRFFGGTGRPAPGAAPRLAAPLLRMGYGPRAASQARCTRWVRQPGPRFGQCLGRVGAVRTTQR